MIEFWYWLEGSELAFQVGATWWFPMIESLHVLAAAFLLGAILMVDLRLMGLAAMRYPGATMMKELLPWTWLAFVFAIITGALLFIVQASNYASNPAFLAKAALLALAGLNILFLHYYVLPHRAGNGEANANNTRRWSGAALSGGLSLLLWCGVMLAGRWIGHIV